MPRIHSPDSLGRTVATVPGSPLNPLAAFSSALHRERTVKSAPAIAPNAQATEGSMPLRCSSSWSSASQAQRGISRAPDPKSSPTSPVCGDWGDASPPCDLQKQEIMKKLTGLRLSGRLSPVLSSPSHSSPGGAGDSPIIKVNSFASSSASGSSSPSANLFEKSLSYSSLDGEDKTFDDADIHLHTKREVENLTASRDAVDAEGQVEYCKGIRLISKRSRDARLSIAKAGGIHLLVSLLTSDLKEVARHSALALLNLGLEKDLRDDIVLSGAVGPLVDILNGSDYRGGEGEGLSLREAAAGALCCLSSCSHRNRIVITASDAVPALVNAFKDDGSSVHLLRDCIMALFNLSTDETVLREILKSGVVRTIIDRMEDDSDNPQNPLENEMVALLANLCNSDYGRSEVVSQRGILALASVVEGGSRSAKSNAIAALLLLVDDDQLGDSCERVLKREGILPTLSVLAQSDMPRCSDRAAQLLELLQQ